MELTVQKREKLGKKAKAWMQEGLIPAEFYGHNLKNLHLAVRTNEFEKIFREAGENTIINLSLGKEFLPALIYDVQRDYLKDSVIHVDFYGVKMDEKIKTRVPLEFVGESPAVREKGGVLNKTLSEIEVESLPANLPHKFIVDISTLADINESIYIKDLKISPGVGVLLDPETVLVTVMPPREEEKEETPVEVSEVKVETEEKVAERALDKEEQNRKEQNESRATA